MLWEDKDFCTGSYVAFRDFKVIGEQSATVVLLPSSNLHMSFTNKAKTTHDLKSGQQEMIARRLENNCEPGMTSKWERLNLRPWQL